MTVDFGRELQTALALHQQNSLEAAATIYRKLLSDFPQHPDLLHLLGVVAYQTGRLDEARNLILQAIAINPTEAQYHSNLGNVLQAQLDFEGAAASYRRALELAPSQFVVANNLGNALHHLGLAAEAEAAYLYALQLNPQYVDGLSNYGAFLHGVKRYGEALDWLRRGLALAPDELTLQLNFANTLRDVGHPTQAMPIYQRILERDARHVEANYGMALTRRLAGDIAGALTQLQHCLDLDPRYADAHHAMIAILEGEPDHAQTLAAFRKALAAQPLSSQLHSVIAYSTDFDPALTAAQQQLERKRWYAQQILPQAIAPLEFRVDRDPCRKLRIGFIPGRFYRNASAYAYLPILLRLDRDRFEIHCYDNFTHSDDITDLIRARADGWRNIARMSDAEVACQIRDDRIDILVDLFAHAGANRLAIYEHKPAPIQVTAWGHANGTGMATMDYLFSDPVSIPPEETALYAEHVVYLPCQLSYWLPEHAPPIASLPAEAQGTISFGCFNRMIKVSNHVLDIWAELLTAVPGSRLILKAAELDDCAYRDKVWRHFERAGIERKRIVMYPASAWFDHLARYGEVDIALDPFPMGGGVTTLDALWMGIPVVCLRGNTLGQRITSAIMTAIGLADWVATTQDEYLQLARSKANDLGALKQVRLTLRKRMIASPLANPEYYVRCVEHAFRGFWEAWCHDPKGRLPRPAAATFDVPETASPAHALWSDFLAQPGSPDVSRRLSASMRRAGKAQLAAELAASKLT